MKTTKTYYKLLTASLLTAIVAPNLLSVNPVSATGTPWGPDRETFTWDKPATYATFNSIINNPDIGDERDFVRIREVKDGETFSNEVNLEVGKAYEVYIYYHNNASADIGKTAAGIAEGVVMKSSFPSIVKKDEAGTVTGEIATSNANPLSVWDGAYLHSTQDVYLRYIPNTAIIHNGGSLNGSNISSDYLFGDQGMPLGYNQFSGILPGCNEYAGYVTYRIFVDAPDFTVEKTIVDGSSTVKAGDELTFKVSYKNTGTMTQTQVVVQDSLPEGLTYVAGSAKLYNNNNKDGKTVNDDLVTKNGMNIGDYAGGDGWADITYRVKVKDTVNCGDTLKNSVIVSTNDGNKTAEVALKVDDGTCKVPEEIVSTGPLEITMAIIIALGIGGSFFYLWRTRRTLKTVENTVSGKAETTTSAAAGNVDETTTETTAKQQGDNQ